MSSIISHVYISNILKEKYKLGDEFLYGAILPDILHKAIPAQRREMTHYLRHGILYGSEGNYPDIERFIIENTEILPKSQMMQGYLAHLIEDMIWFSIYIPRMTIEKDKKTIIYKKDNSVHTDDEFRNDIYSDYTIMDRYLLKKTDLNIEKLQKEFLAISDDINLKSTIKENFKLFDLRGENLILISLDMLEEYISASLEKVSLVLDKIYR